MSLPSPWWDVAMLWSGRSKTQQYLCRQWLLTVPPRWRYQWQGRGFVLSPVKARLLMWASDSQWQGTKPPHLATCALLSDDSSEAPLNLSTGSFGRWSSETLMGGLVSSILIGTYKVPMKCKETVTYNINLALYKYQGLAQIYSYTYSQIVFT